MNSTSKAYTNFFFQFVICLLEASMGLLTEKEASRRIDLPKSKTCWLVTRTTMFLREHVFDSSYTHCHIHKKRKKSIYLLALNK
jgi:hypothetical protein